MGENMEAGLASGTGLGLLLGLVRVGRSVPHPAHSLAGTEGSKVAQAQRGQAVKNWARRWVGQAPRCRAHGLPGHQLCALSLSRAQRPKGGASRPGTGTGGSVPAQRAPAWSEPSGGFLFDYVPAWSRMSLAG